MARIFLISLALAVACSGCSPYLYKSELTALNTSTVALSNAAQAQNEWEEADRRVNVERRLRQLHADAMAAGLPLPVPSVSQACALVAAARSESVTTALTLERALEPGCHLELRAPISGTPSETNGDAVEILDAALARANNELEWQSAHFAIAPLLDALAQYAAGLVALTDASDAQALASAQAELASGIGGLAASIGPASEASERQALGQALGNTVGSLWRANLDRRRLETLQSAVAEADAALGTLEDPITTYLDAVRERQVQRERRELFAAIFAANIELRAGPMGEDEYVALILALDEKVAEFIARANSDPSRAFETLVESHHALLLAVNDTQRQFAGSMPAIIGFVEAAAELEASAAAFNKNEDTDDGAT